MSGFAIGNPEAWKVGPGYCAAVTRWLDASGVKWFAGPLFYWNNRLYSIADNGGEICVQLVNVWESPVSVAYTADGAPVSPATLLSRIWDALHERAIDYEFRAEQEGEPWVRVAA